MRAWKLAALAAAAHAACGPANSGSAGGVSTGGSSPGTRAAAPALPNDPITVSLPAAKACHLVPSGAFSAILGTKVTEIKSPGSGTCDLYSGPYWVAAITYQKVSPSLARVIRSAATKVRGTSVWNITKGWTYVRFLHGYEYGISLGLKATTSCNSDTDPRRCVRGSPAVAIEALQALT
jgi:hypothetical protein